MQMYGTIRMMKSFDATDAFTGSVPTGNHYSEALSVLLLLIPIAL